MRRMTDDGRLGWGVVLPGLVVPLMGCLVYFVWWPDGKLGQMAYGITKVFLLVYPLLWVCRTGWGGLWRGKDGGGTGSVGWRTSLLTGIGSGVVIAVGGVVLMLSPLGELVREGAGRVGERADDLGFREHFVVFAVFLSVVHSALEEFYWRWFVYGNLQALCGRWWAHGIAGIGFAAHHLVVTMQFFPFGLALFLALCVALGGVIWSLMYERQGTVLGCWISHLCVDVFLMVVGYQLLGAAT